MNRAENQKNIPVYKVKMMSDDEWNRLAYMNYLKRNQKNTENSK